MIPLRLYYIANIGVCILECRTSTVDTERSDIRSISTLIIEIIEPDISLIDLISTDLQYPQL